jgi:hypothetical protein
MVAAFGGEGPGSVNIEGRPLPVMQDFDYDNLVLTFTTVYNSSWKCVQLAAEQPLPGQTIWSLVRHGRRYGPSITVQITPVGLFPPAKLGQDAV